MTDQRPLATDQGDTDYQPVPTTQRNAVGPTGPHDSRRSFVQDPNDDTNRPVLTCGQTIFAVLAVLATIGAAVDGASTHYLPRLVAHMIQLVQEAGAVGYLLYSLVTMVCSLCFVPLVLIDIAGTFAFVNALGFWRGWGVSTLCIVFGALAAAQAGFLLGRYTFADAMARLRARNATLKAVDRAIETQGLKLVTLFRLSPVLPFTLSNYAIGATKCSWPDFTAANFAIIPNTVAYCYIGAVSALLLGDATAPDTAGESEEEAAMRRHARLLRLGGGVVGVVATILSVILVSYYAKRALEEMLADPALPSSPIFRGAKGDEDRQPARVSLLAVGDLSPADTDRQTTAGRSQKTDVVSPV